ncbi:MAG: hypothetical protein P1U63_03925 [Coxiellaceae bacterium]|nr:hypothetical protein [Coxiellaceae bacterium]
MQKIMTGIFSVVLAGMATSVAAMPVRQVSMGVNELLTTGQHTGNVGNINMTLGDPAGSAPYVVDQVQVKVCTDTTCTSCLAFGVVNSPKTVTFSPATTGTTVSLHLDGTGVGRLINLWGAADTDYTSTQIQLIRLTANGSNPGSNSPSGECTIMNACTKSSGTCTVATTPSTQTITYDYS